jgi:hypothetical protein
VKLDGRGVIGKGEGEGERFEFWVKKILNQEKLKGGRRHE